MRLRTIPVVLIVVGSGLAVSVAGRIATSRVARPAGLAAADVPGAHARPMGQPVVFPGDATRGAFRLKAPADAVVRPGQDDTLVLGVRIGPDASVLVVQFPGAEPDAKAGIEDMREGVDGDGVRVGPARRTRVGSMDAYAADVRFGSRSLLREFRFTHAGQLWGIGVLVPQHDAAALDTALTMVGSFRFG